MPRNSLVVASVFLLFGLLGAATAEPAACYEEKDPNSIPLSLSEKFEIDGSGVRVFYAKTGAHALVDVKDVNANGIPDYVENVAKQADAARKAYNILGLRDPFESVRYRNATFIDINIASIAANGVAFSEPIFFPDTPGRGLSCSLRIDISNALANFPGSWSIVAHELFHLYQWGYTMLKRPWLIEPTANWAERVIRSGSLHPVVAQPLPATRMELEAHVFSQVTPYDFWSRLANLMDQFEDSLQLPLQLRYATYTDGSPIFKDDTVRGIAFLSSIFQSLDAEDDVIAQENGWPQYRWGSNQNSPSHDMRILQVVQRAIRRTGIEDHELSSFLNIE